MIYPNDNPPEIDSDILLTLVFYLGLVLLIIGATMLVLYIVGEVKPSAWDFIKSEGLRKRFRGLPNRLIFGLGGLLTLLVGAGCMGLIKLLERSVVH